MSSTKYIVRLGDDYVHVTSDEISSTGQTFRLSHVYLGHSQRLKVRISGKLYPLIGRTNEGDERNLAIIAGVFKLLTKGRNVEAANQYIGTDEGKRWLHELIVPETLDKIQEINNIARSTKGSTCSPAQPDSHAPNVLQYVNSLSMAQMEDASQQECPNSDAAAVPQVKVKEFLVFLSILSFLLFVFMILSAMPN